MKLNFVRYLIVILLLTSCNKQESKVQSYGFSEKGNDNLHVPLKISEFKNYGMLVDRIREITCKDSIPKIAIEKKYLTRNIYPIEHCIPITFDPKGKHYVSFENGKAYKNHFSKEIKKGSLKWILKNDFAYYRVVDKTDVIESYLVIIESNKNGKVDGIEKFLIDLTQEFDKLNTELELNISFWEVIPYMPPPLVNEKLKQNIKI